MKVLLIAYEYPPFVAAQALRWFYLANELAALGHQIHVVCPRLELLKPYPVAMHPGVTEHRVWPGPFLAFSQWVALRSGGMESTGDTRTSPSLAFRAYRSLRFLLNRVLYPDVRSEWYPFARRSMFRLLERQNFDVIISSHEPGVDLFLGIWVKKRYRLPWIVDLADPLCAPYSPRWRRWLDRWVEGKVIHYADKVLLTTDRLRGLLIDRHGSEQAEKYVCVPQGATCQTKKGDGGARRSSGKMTLVFTGNFYEAFRNPAHFAEALKRLASDEIAVTIVGDNAQFAHLFAGMPDIMFLGRTSHFDCLALQGEADVLLNFGNAQSYQIPGKIYEYMGAGRPILHIRFSRDDPGAVLLSDSGLGVVVDNDPELIVAALTSLLERWRAGKLLVDEEVTRQLLKQYGWGSRAKLICDVMTDLAGFSTGAHAHAE